jgi:hypothetical protein
VQIAPRQTADLASVLNFLEALEAAGLVYRDGEWWMASSNSITRSLMVPPNNKALATRAAGTMSF